MRVLVPLRSRRVLRFLAPGVTLLLLLSAGAFAAVETENVQSYWDGLWWSLSLVSTVGFVGAVPTTAVGKVVSGTLMVLGFVLLATTTAAVASFFVREDDLPEDERALGFERDVRAALRDLDARLEAIERGLTGVARSNSGRRMEADTEIPQPPDVRRGSAPPRSL